ncbi:MAG: glycosyltransferase [Armatimonadota bacterium]|nr:glycosyltransferase [Armatimonadota bacterium]
MRVVQVTTKTGDGVGTAVSRLHQSLLQLGIDSAMFVAVRGDEPPDSSVVLYRPPRDLPARLVRQLRRVSIALGRMPYRRSQPRWVDIFSDDRSVHGDQVLAQLPPGDVVHVHAMIGFLDYRLFLGRVVERAPVVRTLHDMNFFTGGCHYDGGCGKYAVRCGACPQLGSSRERDLSRRVWQRKLAVLERIDPGRLWFVAPSRWLADAATRASLLGKFRVAVIPHGLDTEVFAPRDRGFCRALLGIPDSARVVLFVAHPLGRHDKGFTFLTQALERLSDLSGLMLITAGGGLPPAEVGVPHLRLGYVRGEQFLSVVYSAADVLAVPSLQETFSQVALEAQACGTPVVAFAVGGIPEVVRHGHTGLTVPVGDVRGLADGIRRLVEDGELRKVMSSRARGMVVEEHTLEIQARRYKGVYEALLGHRGAQGASGRGVVGVETGGHETVAAVEERRQA